HSVQRKKNQRELFFLRTPQPYSLMYRVRPLRDFPHKLFPWKPPVIGDLPSDLFKIAAGKSSRREPPVKTGVVNRAQLRRRRLIPVLKICKGPRPSNGEIARVQIPSVALFLVRRCLVLVPAVFVSI